MPWTQRGHAALTALRERELLEKVTAEVCVRNRGLRTRIPAINEEMEQKFTTKLKTFAGSQ